MTSAKDDGGGISSPKHQPTTRKYQSLFDTLLQLALRASILIFLPVLFLERAVCRRNTIPWGVGTSGIARVSCGHSTPSRALLCLPAAYLPPLNTCSEDHISRNLPRLVFLWQSYSFMQRDKSKVAPSSTHVCFCAL